MASRAVSRAVSSWNNLLRGVAASSAFALAAFVCAALFSVAAHAKEPSLTAIELYDGATGAAYIQLSGVLLNGKIEVHECTPGQGPTLDKSTYGKMPKLTLAAGGVLERGTDGVLRYSSAGAKPICVLPANLKFEHSSSYQLSALAEQADLKGSPIAPGSDGATAAPALKKGVKLVFIPAPNLEYAEFLRAQRASAIADWQAYLAKYPATPHTTEARQSLSALFIAAGEASLVAYDKSTNTNTPSYADLKAAKADADHARALVASSDGYAKLTDKLRAALTAIALTARGELNAYRDALSSHSKGYAHLVTAQQLTELVTGIDPQFQPGLDLLAEVGNASRSFDKAVKDAEDAVSKKQMDAAVTAIAPYHSFASEEPRTTAVLDAIYGFYMDLGEKAGQAQDWPTAVTEYEKAVVAKETPEAQDALKNAREQKTSAMNTAAARLAVERSNSFEQEHDILQAYETLAALTPEQQKLAAEAMTRLKPLYVQAAVQRAKELQKVHSPIKGVEDGFEMENAYTYLKRANDLIPDDSYDTMMSAYGNELSAFFLSQARKYLFKPEGSGTEVAWAYLQEALAYKALNQNDVRDARTSAEIAHSMHSRLSIQVQFRDGTSQRDSAGFATELENKTITGLESCSVPVRAIRYGDITAVKPDYQLIGDVTQHHITETPTLESMQSKFYAGSGTEPNEEWIKANRAVETLNEDLRTAQTSLQIATAKGKKSQIDLWTKKVSEAQKKLTDARIALDSVPRERTIEIIQPYNYTKRTIDYNITIELQFRLDETLSGQRSESIPISRTDHKQVIILEGVKAEDRGGVKTSGTIPEKGDLLADFGTAIRPELIDAVRKKVESLPQTIYDAAHKKEGDGDSDGAAEGYLRYLNLSPKSDSSQAAHARAFLNDVFHLRPDTTPVP